MMRELLRRTRTRAAAPFAPPPVANGAAAPACAASSGAAWPPVIEADRFTLRVPGPQDFERFAAFFGSGRARFVGGPVGRDQAWRVLGTVIGHWSLRGWGPFALVPRGETVAAGSVGPWFPEGWPEPEIGWMLWDARLEGCGLMRDAALAARRHAYGDLGWTTAVSYIAPDNTRSRTLAERLGAWPDPDAARHDGDPHLVYRHPGPEVAA